MKKLFLCFIVLSLSACMIRKTEGDGGSVSPPIGQGKCICLHFDLPAGCVHADLLSETRRSRFVGGRYHHRHVHHFVWQLCASYLSYQMSRSTF